MFPLPSSSAYIRSLLHVLELVRSASGLSIVEAGWGQAESTYREAQLTVLPRLS